MTDNSSIEKEEFLGESKQMEQESLRRSSPKSHQEEQHININTDDIPLTESTSMEQQEIHEEPNAKRRGSLHVSIVSTLSNPMEEDLQEEKKDISPNGEQDDDALADRIAQMMSLTQPNRPGLSRQGSSIFGETLAKRAVTIDAIHRYSRHVPNCVLKDIYSEATLADTNVEIAQSNITPKSQKYQAALLFIDMSGFTKLSQALDVESLSKAINSYFQAIVDEVVSHGGDILKFAGDAIFAEWRVEIEDESITPPSTPGKKSNMRSSTRNITTRGNTRRSSMEYTPESRLTSARGGNRRRSMETSSSRAPSTRIRQRPSGKTLNRMSSSASISSESAHDPENLMNMEDCVHAAACCGAAIVNKCADYPIYEEMISGGQGPLVATLNVHCGLGAGEMAGVHVGDDVLRREYLVVGEPIDQVAEACDTAQLGEIRIAGEALKYLNKGQPYKMQMTLEKGEKSKLIASRKTTYFNKKRRSVWSLDGKIRKPTTAKPQIMSLPIDEMSDMSLSKFHHLLSLYVHPVVLGDKDEKVDLRKSMKSTRKLINSGDQKQATDAELRSVFTLFVMPKMEAKLSQDPKQNQLLFKKLNNIMTTVSSILDSFKGHLRQYIVDDKGIVLIGTFGLRGATFTNMIAERALPTCRYIHDVLQEDLKIECQVGGTLGKVYCGVVGGVKRHEYAVLGPSVNLSARLMGNKNNPGVLVDDAVRRKARGSNFISFPPVKAKGYEDLVPVFKPLTAKEARWGRVNPKFVGRKKELDLICKLALATTKKDSTSKMLFVWGESGSGKSAFIVSAISKARSLLLQKKKRSVVTRNATSERDSLIPFSLFRHIFLDVLSEKPISDDSTLGSKSKNDDGFSLSSGSTFAGNAQIIRRLTEICDEMGAPRGFLEIVGQHLLGDNKGKVTTLEKAPEMDEIIEFMAKVFIRSTDHAEGVILALDDVQWMDSLSWKVVQRILETSRNVLIVCGSRPKESHPLSVTDEFWGKLTGEYAEKKLFREITIAELNEDDIREMAALSFGCNPNEIDDNFCEDVFSHSGGMPFFTSEILDNCVKKKQCGKLKNGLVGWLGKDRDALSFANIEELFLQRIDHLDDFTRKVLQFGAILGMTFDSDDLLNLALELSKPTEDERKEFISAFHQSVQAAIEEGILTELFIEPDDDDEVQINQIDPHSPYEEQSNTNGYVEYSFHQTIWRRLILSLLLDSYVQNIHRHIAMMIERQYPVLEDRYYRTNVKLFTHHKGSHDTLKTSEVALHIGNEFKNLGMTDQSVKVYDGAIELWLHEEAPDGTERVAGFSPLVLESLDEQNLVALVSLMTKLGQSLGSMAKQTQDALNRAVDQFQNALKILEYAPISSEVKDRSFTFPIYSGLFFLLKFGIICDPSDVAATELDLVSKFVAETKLHGDPVHYGRALAMQGETCHRYGRFEEAIESHVKLKQVYDVEKHSALVVAAYASDRCAQNFGVTSNCYVLTGQIDKALEIANHIEFELMPHMNLKNVHNSAVTLFPILWMLKDNGQIERSYNLFKKYLKEPFDQFYGKDGSTPFLPTFKPFQVLFDTCLYMENDNEGDSKMIDESYFDWALNIDNMKCFPRSEVAIGNFGRGPMSISAEACLNLAKITKDEDKKMQILKNGATLAELTTSGIDGSNGPKNHFAYLQIKGVHDEIKYLLGE